MTVALLLPNGQVYMIDDVISWKTNGPHLRLHVKSGGDPERIIQTNVNYFFLVPRETGTPDWTMALKQETNW
jgi:hypothetical protein